MRQTGYRAALEWIVLNDDSSWLDDGEPIPSVTACFLAGIFGQELEKVIADLRKTAARLDLA